MNTYKVERNIYLSLNEKKLNYKVPKELFFIMKDFFNKINIWFQPYVDNKPALEIHTDFNIDTEQYKYFIFKNDKILDEILSYIKYDMHEGARINKQGLARNFIEKTGYYEMKKSHQGWSNFRKDFLPNIVFKYNNIENNIDFYLEPINLRQNKEIFEQYKNNIFYLN